MVAEQTNPKNEKGGLKEALENADLYIGYTLYFSLPKDFIKTMKKDVF